MLGTAGTNLWQEFSVTETVITAGTYRIALTSLDGATSMLYGAKSGQPSGTSYFNFNAACGYFSWDCDPIPTSDNNETKLIYVGVYLERSGNSFTLTKPPYRYYLASGLVGHWTFDGPDITNGVVRDKSGNGNQAHPGRIATSTFYAAGKIGQAVNFDGNNDYIDIEENSGMPIYSDTDPYSVAFWMKAVSGSSGCIYAETGDTFFTNFAFCDNNFGDMYVFIRNDAVSTVGPATEVSEIFDNSWHHVVWTDQGGTAKMYIDGALHSGSWNYTPSGTFSLDVTYLGVNINPGSINNTMTGSIDDVRTYNRVLSATEVQQLYNFGNAKSGVTPQVAGTSGLVAHWTFDGKDMRNGVAQDRSGNDKHGNLFNISTSTFYTVGKIGQGTNYDGVDDYIDAGNVSGTVRTVAFWIKPNTTTQSILDVNGTATIDISGGTVAANNFDSPTIYVNGVVSSTLVAGFWQHVTVTTGTALDANNVDLGRISTSYLSGSLDDVRMFNNALTAAEIRQLYNVGK